jgi:D-alanyl-lipoteichoic acid acyltransferase DltB (MBOAT superfamily)
VLLAPSFGPAWRQCVLLVANVAFFATFATGPVSVVPFAVFLIAGFGAMRFVERYKNRWVFYSILVGLTFGLCWLKRYAFVPSTALLANVYLTVGLSYAFFRVVSLVVDAYQNALPARVSLVSYANYTLNFTTFVAGPIQLYPPFRRDEERPARLSAEVAGRATERIVMGLFKVMVASPALLFAHQHALQWSGSALALPARVLDTGLILAIYPAYIYANISGYTDAVIGAARFLGMELPENFNVPFVARGFIEFWGRWHMSLANWFKTYVYSPMLLAMMRRFPSAAAAPTLGVLAYFVTFFLVGVWHGQTWMFVIFGFVNGAGMSGNKLYQLAMTRWMGRVRYQALCAHPAYAAVSSGLTFFWLCLVLVFFWASWTQLGDLVRVAGAPAIGLAVAAVILGFALLYWPAIAIATAAGRILAKTPAGYLRAAGYAAVAVVVVTVAVIFNAPAPQIAYKAF